MALGALVIGGSVASGPGLVFGVAYLAAAGSAGGFALLLLGPAIAAQRRGGPVARAERAGPLGQIAVLAGWQLAALGLLSIWAASSARPPWLLAPVFFLVATSLAVDDRMLALADAPDATGTRHQLRFLGVEGNRRVFFWVFVFPLSLPFLLGGAMLFLGGPPYAAVFFPPRLGLAIVAVYNVATAILVRQRYRGGRPGLKRIGFAAAATICLAAMALPFGLSWWLYCLSAAAALAVAEGARWLAGALVPPAPGTA